MYYLLVFVLLVAAASWKDELCSFDVHLLYHQTSPEIPVKLLMYYLNVFVLPVTVTTDATIEQMQTTLVVIQFLQYVPKKIQVNAVMEELANDQANVLFINEELGLAYQKADEVPFCKCN